MKKIIAGMALAGVLFAGNAFAEDDMGLCEFTAVISERIMQSRQSNMDMMAVSKKMGEIGLPESVNDLVQLLIREAWRQPRYSSESYQENAVMDFKNKYYLGCVETVSSN